LPSVTISLNLFEFYNYLAGPRKKQPQAPRICWRGARWADASAVFREEIGIDIRMFV